MKALLLAESSPSTPGGSPSSEARQDDAAEQQNSTLQIRIHGVDGRVFTFTEDDPSMVRRIVLDSQRPDFFKQERIAIAGQHSVTLLVLSNVARIDLAGEALAMGKPPYGIRDVVELPEDEFFCQVEARDLMHVERRRVHLPPGGTAAAFVDIQLARDQHIYLKFRITDVLPAERMQRIRSFLGSPGLSFRLAGGGLGIPNLANAVKLTAYPGPAELPADAWSANENNGLSRE
jgi:hypothetical protein